MSVLCVPPPDPIPWPSLGPQVCDWIEANLVFGPGGLLGERARIDAGTRAIIRRAYEIYPHGHRMAGRRRFQEATISLRKGTAKTEKAAWIVICEAHPAAPVRFDDWGSENPGLLGGFEPGPGKGLPDPYIPLLATTEGQSETLTYDAVKSILERSEVAADFDIALSRIVRENGRGMIEAVTTSPDARDGGRTSFQVIDESHRLTDTREKEAVEVMKANVPKLKVNDAWTLKTTTAFQPGQGSVAEDDMDYAREIASGKAKDPSLFFFHRQADDGHDINDEDEVRQAIEEASGPGIVEWTNIDGILAYWRNPKTDRSYFERVWLNRPVLSDAQVFDMNIVRKRIEVRSNPWPRDRTEITLGFDGSRTRDATFLVGTELETGYQFTVAYWERPADRDEDVTADDWEVPGDEVNEAFRDAMKRWRVRRVYADPRYWENHVDSWNGLWPKVFAKWPTSALRKTALAVQQYVQSWKAGEITYDGHRVFTEHLGNSRKREMTFKDEDGNALYLLEKDARGSVNRIDGAYAGLLSWQARSDAISKGALKRAGSRAGRTAVITY